MALYLLMTANGAPVNGDATNPGYADQIKVYSANFGYAARTDAGSGMRTGRSTASPVSFSTAVGKHSPLVFKALVENEVIEATLTFDPSDDGDNPLFKVILENGRIGKVDNDFSALGGLNDCTTGFSVTFNIITVEYVDGGIMHTDTIND